MPFAEFMDAALYDPEEGFYERGGPGPDADFATAPHVSPAFGDLVARQLGECWDALGRPVPFDVVEAGAGDGTLAAQILRAAGSVPELADALAYRAVERSTRGRRALSGRGIDARPRMADAPHDVTGVVLANELLDNLPFHRLADRAGRTVEIFVGIEGGRFVEVEGEPTPTALASLRAPLRPGEERPVSPAALGFLADVRRTLGRGYAFLFDYGFVPGEPPQPVRAYARHRESGDVLADPGSRDITTEVDLGALAGEARELGFEIWGPVRQRDALRALGLDLWMEGARRRQAEAEAAGDSRGALRLYDARRRAEILTDEGHLGKLYLLALGMGVVPAPSAVRTA